MSVDAAAPTAPLPLLEPGTIAASPWWRHHRVRLALRYLLLTFLALIVLFPVYITVVNSLLRPDLIAARPPTLFPTHPLWGTYSDAWSSGHLGRYLVNSFVVTAIVVT